MVCFGWNGDDGMVTEKSVNHYRAIAKGGYGLVIQEATCINRQGRLSGDQLGIWDDAQIPGLKQIVDAGTDLVIANDISREGCHFGSDNNEVLIVDGCGDVLPVSLASKKEIAKAIFDVISQKI